MRPLLAAVLLLVLSVVVGCRGVISSIGEEVNQPTPPQTTVARGVLMWKGDTTGTGHYPSESALTLQNVNPQQFGRKHRIQLDGIIVAQPLYLSGLEMGTQGTKNVILAATEHNSVYAIDADTGAKLWERHYVDPATGVTTLPDNFGGRTTLGGEVGITGTPVINSATGTMYFVTTLVRNGTPEQWLRAIDVRTGQDVGPGSMKIDAAVSGDGRGSLNGSIRFDPAIHNQRPGLVLHDGAVLVAWGSFSDYGVYHGWLMAFDANTLALRAVYNPTTQAQTEDTAYGPADFGGGGAFWAGGALPSVDSAGNIFIVAGDGSFNADKGGTNFGNAVLKLRLEGNAFRVADWFVPSNEPCVNPADLEIGSGGVALLPAEAGGGRNLAVVINKEGRLYLLDRDNLGKINRAGDTQIPQQFLVGNQACFDGMGDSFAEGTNWNRIYGNVAFWNGNIYVAPSNMAMRQYRIEGGRINTAAVAQTSSGYGMRGGNAVVSSNAGQNAILWVYEKRPGDGFAVLHAYDATNISRELWNSQMNAGRDFMGTGVSFGVPVVAEGRVIATDDRFLNVFGLLN